MTPAEAFRRGHFLFQTTTEPNTHSKSLFLWNPISASLPRPLLQRTAGMASIDRAAGTSLSEEHCGIEETAGVSK
jgi:hypothetical protein